MGKYEYRYKESILHLRLRIYVLISFTQYVDISFANFFNMYNFHPLTLIHQPTSPIIALS